MLPANIESDVDLLEADREPTSSQTTKWWPLGRVVTLSLAVAVAGLFVLVGMIVLKTHRSDVGIPTEGEGYFVNFGDADAVSISKTGQVDIPLKAFQQIATSFTDGLKNEGAVTDFSTFAKDTVVSAKAFMESKGIKPNVFVGFCDSFRCFGCEEKVHKTTIRVKDGSNWFSSNLGGVHKFCLVMGPQSSEFTIQRLNDEQNWFMAGNVMPNSLSPKSLSFGDTPEIMKGHAKVVVGSLYLKLKKKYGEEKAKKIFARLKADVAVYHKLKEKYGAKKAKQMMHSYLHKRED